MPDRVRQVGVGELVGREVELACVREFLEGETPCGLLIEGEAGIGKTMLWQKACELAGQAGARVLSARPNDAEVGLSFSALADLLAAIDLSGVKTVPIPQRRALDAALARADLQPGATDPLAISAGFLNTLRTLAERQPLVVAVDDVGWIDRDSADTLAYAARRLRGHPVRFLFARRPDAISALERAFDAGSLQRLEVGPLSLGAIRIVLSERLALSVPRRTLRHTFETAEGNPLFALEIGRVLLEQGPPPFGDVLPMPDTIERLLEERVTRLPPSARRLLLATALGGHLRASEIPALAGPSALEEAVDAGVLVVDAERVRPSHPLLAAAVLKRSRAHERRELHGALAAAADDEVARARHLALAATGTDAELADRIAEAATVAGARGATLEAFSLWEQALRLTPVDADARPERVLSLAHHLAVAGEKERVTQLLSTEMDNLPAGSARARAWLIRPGGLARGNDEIRGFLERALEESRDDAALRAGVLGNLSFNSAYIRVEQVQEAEEQALDALSVTRRGEPGIERSVLYALACTRSLRGKRLDDVCEQFERLATAQPYVLATPERIAALRLVWRGELEAARGALASLQALADERGEAMGYAHIRMHLCELELRAGGFEQASLLLDEWSVPAERELMPFPFYERCQALLACGLGHAADAERWAAEAMAVSEVVGERWSWLEALRTRGVGALFLGRPALAVETLQHVWDHTVREGIDEPGAFPVAPDLVEALVELEELEQAREVCARLATLARRQRHPWGLASARRSAALVRFGLGDEGALADLTAAADAYGLLGLRFDRARALLLVGRGARRFRKWAVARDALHSAAEEFTELGADGWAEQASSELGRVAGRRPRARGALTASENQVVELAAAGLSNKEIAGRLVISVYTVERHLSHAYRKLGIRSRSQLAMRLQKPQEET